MRKIKFRFWDITLNKYYPLGTADWIGDVDVNDILNSKNFITEQFTGMFDDNGVEIYEGDIVKIIAHDEDKLCGLGEEYICTVHFGGGDWWGSFTIKNDEFHKGFALLANRRNDRVVIGNIHEHKHSLENKND